jgi:hypothetical protein
VYSYVHNNQITEQAASSGDVSGIIGLVSGSKPGRDAGGFSWFTSVSTGMSWASTTTGSLQHPSHFRIHYHPVIRNHVVSVTDSVVKQAINKSTCKYGILNTLLFFTKNYLCQLRHHQARLPTYLATSEHGMDLFRLVSGRCLLWISTGTPAILNEVFHSFSPPSPWK